ncbi:ABC-2 transporter permease [Paenibacillus sp. PK3_47]|uniref:ABC-2 transporter permease n=1 Tax=Paenibacillus sp. PK3_47 TaxID=2072642 RepID=UPI00201E32AC|nr:ABC-2 transporter permease [Paenibacillus sp. PK3_47]UQZ36476.1 ABC-2 transporter permease [Paenibacillus sp. PK3_47]
MRGLFLNNYYSMQSNIKVSLSIAVALLLVTFFVSDIKVMNALIAGQIMLFAVSIGSSLQVDEASKWSRMEITLLVKRSTVIGAKYLSFVMLLLLGMAISVCTTILLSLKESVSLANLWNGYSFGLSLAIPVISVCFPAILKFGVEKNEMLLFLSVAAALGMRFLVWVLINMTGNTVNFNGSEVGNAALMVSLLMFAASYFLSVRIQENKEF